MTDREHDEIEVAELERRLAGVEDPSRQVARTTEGARYRESLRADIASLRERLSSEGD